MDSAGSQHANAPSVFISYARTDSQFARQLADQLRAFGIDVYLDVELDVGDSFAAQLQAAIGRAKVMIVLMSPAYFQSRWTQAELSLALVADKTLLPILLEGEPQGPLSHFQYLDVSKSTDASLPEEIANLVRRVS